MRKILGCCLLFFCGTLSAQTTLGQWSVGPDRKMPHSGCVKIDKNSPDGSCFLMGKRSQLNGRLSGNSPEMITLLFSWKPEKNSPPLVVVLGNTRLLLTENEAHVIATAEDGTLRDTIHFPFTATDKWHHLTFRFRGDEKKLDLLIDGNIEQYTTRFNRISAGPELTFGGETKQHAFRGRIDAIIAFNDPIPRRPPENHPVVQPYAYFQFEKNQQGTSANKIKGVQLDATNNNGYFTAPPASIAHVSPVGDCWHSEADKTAHTATFAYANKKMPDQTTDLTVELALKFNPDNITPCWFGLSGYQFFVRPEAIAFYVTGADANHDTIRDEIKLKEGPFHLLFDSIFDGRWHHFAFRFEGDTVRNKGALQIFIDGKTNPAFRKNCNFARIKLGKGISFDYPEVDRNFEGYLDELAIYLSNISPETVVQHSREFFGGQHYGSSETIRAAQPAIIDTVAAALDSLDFGPAFSGKNISQLAQLRSFPLPRYKPNSKLQRNFPWFDFRYLAYDYSLTKRKENTYLYPGWNAAAHAGTALQIDIEMATHWHYDFSLPSPTFGRARDYADNNTISGRLVHYADVHPEIPVATILYWGNVRPKDAGFQALKANILSTENIDPCAEKKGYPRIVVDGTTQKHYLEEMCAAMPHRNANCKIDFINEDGEVFGGVSPPNAEAFIGKPFISCIQTDPKNLRRDRGRWQYEVFHTYASQFANNTAFAALQNTHFSYYQISAFYPKYYGEYSELRKINASASFHGNYYSTPDFYPGRASWGIFDGGGPYHGIDGICDGRKTEIGLGDTYFSPFVCAGWFKEEINYRPSQWLAALKAMGMMGADFYYAAHFNEGNPAKEIPKDPKNYIWQIAMPAYAQAITSRYEDLFFHSKNFVYQRNYNRLLIYRKDERAARYVIYTSLNSFGNDRNAIPQETTNHVLVDGDSLTLDFRRQGSVFIYDKTDAANPVFYQLDGWHESTHPWYWSKDFRFEAELPDDSLPLVLRTERPPGAAPGDYTNFTTFVCFRKNEALHYQFEPRDTVAVNFYVWVRARSTGTSKIEIQLDGNSSGSISIIGKETEWYMIPKPINVSPGAHTFAIKALDNGLELDQMLLSRKKPSASRPE